MIKTMVLVLIAIWYLSCFILTIYLYYRDSKAYPFNNDVDVKKINRSLEDLSLLVYKKIVPEVMTANIVKLIDKGKIKLTSENNIFWLTKIDNEDLNNADFNLMELLFEVIGDGERVNVKRINEFCNKKSGNSEFLFNYNLWHKMSIMCSNKKILFEEKLEYNIVRMIQIIGILLFILNIIFKIFNLFGFIIIIPAILVKIYFFRISKLTFDATQEYYGWLEFRGKLRKDSKLFDNNKYLEYSILLKCYDNISEEMKLAFIKELDAAIKKCYLHSYFRGNRSLFS